MLKLIGLSIMLIATQAGARNGCGTPRWPGVLHSRLRGAEKRIATTSRTRPDRRPGEKPGPTPKTFVMFFVYLLASKPHGTLYIGSISDLVRRVWEHKVRAVPGFIANYGVARLVWFERYETLKRR